MRSLNGNSVVSGCFVEVHPWVSKQPRFFVLSSTHTRCDSFETLLHVELIASHIPADLSAAYSSCHSAVQPHPEDLLDSVLMIGEATELSL